MVEVFQLSLACPVPVTFAKPTFVSSLIGKDNLAGKSSLKKRFYNAKQEPCKASPFFILNCLGRNAAPFHSDCFLKKSFNSLKPLISQELK